MKVLILTGGFPSAENPSKSIFNYRSVLGLKKIVDVTVVHLRFWRPGRKLKSVTKFGEVEVITLALPWVPLNNVKLNALNLVLWQRMAHVLLKKKELLTAEVIHTIGLETAPVGSYISAKTTIPHIAQAIGSDLVFYLPQKEPHFGIRRWVDHTKMVICNSNYLMKQVKERYPGLGARVAYRGTNLSIFKPENKLEKRPLTLLYLGGFSNREGTGFGADLKGGETLKKVWEIIDGKFELEVNLLLGGPLSKSENLKNWVSQLEKPERVSLLGSLLPEEIPELMKKSRVVLIPSYSEGLPNVAVEACACENLVLASNVGGVPDIIIDEETGFLLEAGNVDQWVSKIVEVVKNFDDYDKLRKDARKRVLTDFDAENYPNKLFNIYKDQIQ